MKFKLVPFLVFTLLISCKSDPNKHIDEGTISNQTYHSEDIGWTMEIPDGWEITHRSELNKRTQKGLEAFNETAGTEYEVTELKQLLNFQKDRFHIFQSSSEPFKIEYDGQWEENNKFIYNILYQTYADNGIKVDTTTYKEVINHLEFEVFHITMYGPDGKIMLYQDMYGRHINGFDFSVNLNYIKENEKNEMMKAWKNSTFE